MIKNDLASSGLSAPDIKALARWCESRRLRWSPARADAAHHTIILEPLLPGAGWRRLSITRLRGGYCLADEWGDALAEASSLRVVLDALDGGVAHSSAASGMIETGAGRSVWFT